MPPWQIGYVSAKKTGLKWIAKDFHDSASHMGADAATQGKRFLAGSAGRSGGWQQLRVDASSSSSARMSSCSVQGERSRATNNDLPKSQLVVLILQHLLLVALLDGEHVHPCARATRRWHPLQRHQREMNRTSVREAGSSSSGCYPRPQPVVDLT